MIIPELEEIQADKAHRTFKYLERRYPEFTKYLKDLYGDSFASASELLYRFFNNIIDKPHCKICSNPTRFKNFQQGYGEYCSRKCLNNDPEMINLMKNKREETNIIRYGVKCNFSNPENYNKCKQTWIEKYGVDNPGKSEMVREKTKNTMIERYGVENIFQSENFKQKSINTKQDKYGDGYFTNSQKSVETQRKRYGGVGFESDILKKKYKDTCLQKFGVIHATLSDEISSKISKTKRLRTFDVFPDILNIYDQIATCKCPDENCNLCDEKQYNIQVGLYQQRLRLGQDPCIIRTPLKLIRDTCIEKFIQNILNKYNIEYETNNRTILGGKELDIYIPAYKLAIECNGIYWHSLKEPKYHHDKWKSCAGLGIQLLTVWEDQIINKPEIIRNLILFKLGIYEHRIGARECELKEVSSTESRLFLDLYHLQGSVNGSVRLGLYYKDELVGLMVFGRKRTALGNRDHDTWELYRYCCKQGWQITGGASRLFNHFISEHSSSVVESFSSNDISNGELYRQLGFNNVGLQPHSYWYIDKHMVRHHRYTFRKDVLIRNGADPSLTEFQITDEMGMFRIYDTGQQKWIYEIK